MRAAIIGTGRIGSRLEKDPLRSKPNTHAGWYQSHPRIELVAGADIDPVALDEFGKDWGLKPSRLYSNYEEMLTAERPDIVSVCAWAEDRVEMARSAIEAGARGLWLEKAVACSMADAFELERCLGTSGVVAIVDHPRRAQSEYRAVRRVIAERALGRLESIHTLFSGHWLHTGTHAWDILDFWCGPWSSVTATAEAPEQDAAADGRVSDDRTRPASDDDEDGLWTDRGGRAVIEMADGTAVFVSGCRKRYFVFQFDLVFERGRVTVGNDGLQVAIPAPSTRYSGFVELSGSEAADAFVQPGDSYPFPMVHDLVHAMDTGAAPLMSYRNGVEALSLGVALLQSANAGARRLTRADLDCSIRIHTV